MTQEANMEDKMRSAKLAYDKIVAHAENENAFGYILILPKQEKGGMKYEIVYPLSYEVATKLLAHVAEQELQDYVQHMLNPDLTTSH